MSQFKQQYQEALKGGASLESAEIAGMAAMPVDSSEWTQDDVEDMLEDRDSVIVSDDAVTDLAADGKFLAASSAVTNVVGQAATAAETMPPAVAEAFVDQANCVINDASKVIGSPIPNLKCDEDGFVNNASMEGLSDWFGTAARAFKASTGQFFGRIALTFTRLNESSKGLLNRCSRIRSKIKSRKGAGGKALKISSSDLRYLILGDGYVNNPIAALNEFSALSLSVSQVVEQYFDRVDKILKAKIFDALANASGNRSVFTNIETSDLLKQLTDIISKQPALSLGNVKYAVSKIDSSKIIGVTLQDQTPLAEQLVKHLDPIQSLTNEEVMEWVKGLEDLINAQMTRLEKITDRTSRSFDNVRSTLEKLNYTGGDKDEPLLADDVDVIELLRLENQMVSEVGAICERLASYQQDLVNRLDSALVVVEESLFQD